MPPGDGPHQGHGLHPDERMLVADGRDPESVQRPAERGRGHTALVAGCLVVQGECFVAEHPADVLQLAAVEMIKQVFGTAPVAPAIRAEQVYVELGARALEPELDVTGGWRVIEDEHLNVVVYPSRRTYRCTSGNSRPGRTMSRQVVADR